MNIFLFISSKISSIALIIIYGQNGEILNFSSIKHFLFICTNHGFNVKIGEILVFSSIELTKKVKVYSIEIVLFDLQKLNISIMP